MEVKETRGRKGHNWTCLEAVQLACLCVKRGGAENEGKREEGGEKMRGRERRDKNEGEEEKQ